jgi:hypothetical protein
MTAPMRFLPVRDPPPSLLTEAATLAPTNPFVTPAYVTSRRRLGAQPWALCVEADGRLASACVAFMRSGYLNRALEITSLPELPHPEPFWRGLLEFCRAHRLSQLEVNSFASTTATIPELPGQRRRIGRCEYVLALQAGDLWAQVTVHHRRNIARARKRGLTVRRAADAAACEAHLPLILASMQRRRQRGESVPLEFQGDEFIALTQTGAGELFQAAADGQVLSSALVLRAACGAYMQTMGTNPDGMTCGAAHLLLYEAAAALQVEGLRVFNLGGAGPDNPGLQQFKAGFGARAADLEAAEFYLAGPLRRVLSHSAHRLRRAVSEVAAALSH